jgi:hypothetical protein
MKKFLTFLFWTNLTLTSIQSFGQIDTTAIKDFIQRQQVGEEKFIDFLKIGNIDSCMKFFSASVINKYGTDSLKKELKYLNNLLSKNPHPQVTFSLGQNFQGIGTFGHNSDGNFEKKSLYQFMDKDSVIYFFTLYYNDKEPTALIKFFDSEDLTEDFLKKLKLTPPVLVPVPRRTQ